MISPASWRSRKSEQDKTQMQTSELEQHAQAPGNTSETAMETMQVVVWYLQFLNFIIHKVYTGDRDFRHIPIDDQGWIKLSTIHLEMKRQTQIPVPGTAADRVRLYMQEVDLWTATRTIEIIMADKRHLGV